MKLLQTTCTCLPACCAKMVPAQIVSSFNSDGLCMLVPVKCPSGESGVMISTYLHCSTNNDGCYKVLIENHGMCLVRLEATIKRSGVIFICYRRLTRIVETVPSQLNSDAIVNVTLCNMQPRDKAFLKTVPVNWQSLSKGEATQLQSLIVEYADVFAMDRMELGRTDLIQHVVDTDNRKPIKQAPRIIPFSLLLKVETLRCYH